MGLLAKLFCLAKCIGPAFDCDACFSWSTTLIFGSGKLVLVLQSEIARNTLLLLYKV